MNFNQNILVIFAIIFITCLINSPSTQATDQRIVDRMCGVTNIPEVCQSCVRDTRPTYEVNQDMDVIICMLRCALNDNQHLLSGAIIYAREATNVTVKTVVNGCVENYTHVRFGIMKTQMLTKERSYADAKDVIDTLVYPNMTACDHAIAQSGIPMPPPLFGGSIVVASDFNMARQMLSVIKA
ncbi:hypothetical protein RND81_13G194800 [Saponaria officinalis]|uniref:Uncharacterized protein n=1 Tax=Saponaria officinalis TaxID=3572 RepID=A0AAW1H6H5_SAPOF